MNCFSVVVNLLCICAAIFGLTPEEVRQIVDLYNNNEQQLIMSLYENYDLENDIYAQGIADNMVPELAHLRNMEIRAGLTKTTITLDLGRDTIEIPAFFTYTVFENKNNYVLDFYMIIKSKPDDPIVQLQRIIPSLAGIYSFTLQSLWHSRTLALDYMNKNNANTMRASYKKFALNKTKLKDVCEKKKLVSSAQKYDVMGGEITFEAADLWLNERVKIAIPAVLQCSIYIDDYERDLSSPSDGLYYHYVLSSIGWIKVETKYNPEIETAEKKIYALEEYLLNN